jgi:hypothetical protein
MSYIPGEIIKEHRNKCNLTKQEYAYKYEIDNSMIVSIENNRQTIGTGAFFCRLHQTITNHNRLCMIYQIFYLAYKMDDKNLLDMYNKAYSKTHKLCCRAAETKNTKRTRKCAEVLAMTDTEQKSFIQAHHPDYDNSEVIAYMKEIEAAILHDRKPCLPILNTNIPLKEQYEYYKGEAITEAAINYIK